MKKLLTFGILTLLLVTLIFAFTGQALAKDDTAKAIARGFNLDDNNDGQRLPPGSIVRQNDDGTTAVYKSDNSLILSTKDADAAFIPTPAGPVKATHVFTIPSGAEVSPKGDATEVTKDGKLLLKVIGSKKMTAPQFSGWVEQAADWGIANLDYFSANWRVPSNPPAPSIDTVNFLFTAIEPNTGSAILQPVLEWNQAGSRAWTLRSWFGPLNGNYYCTSPIAANAGNQITGTLSYSLWFGWQITTRNLATYRSATIFTRLAGTSGLAAFCALESYNIRGNQDLPGTTTFNNMLLRYRSAPVTPAWKAYNPPLSSGLTGAGVQIVSPSQVILRTANP